MGAGALFLLQPLQTASLLRAKHAIVTAAATAAIAEPPPAVLHREPARAACSSAASSPHFGLASLSRKTPGGDMRIQLLVRPNRLNLRELHAALAKLPAAEGAALGHAAEANGAAHDASAAAAPAATSGSLLGASLFYACGWLAGDACQSSLHQSPCMAHTNTFPAPETTRPPHAAMGLKGLLEHVCSYPTTQTQRRWHFFVLAHGFSPDPVLTKVLGVSTVACMQHAACSMQHAACSMQHAACMQHDMHSAATLKHACSNSPLLPAPPPPPKACSKLGVSVHFVQFDEPGAGSPLEPPADELAAAVPALIDDDEAPAAAADEGAAAVGSFAESVKAAAGASFVRMTAGEFVGDDCSQNAVLLLTIRLFQPPTPPANTNHTRQTARK
jgi:hypothetical protein